MLDIPASLRRNATGVWGERGEQWLKLLPHVLDEVLDRWSLRVEQPFPMTFHWVAAVRRYDGTPAVLKLALPHADHQAVEAAALETWAGRGAVSLLAQDAQRGALLLQRAQPGHPLRRLVPARDEEATRASAGTPSCGTGARCKVAMTCASTAGLVMAVLSELWSIEDGGEVGGRPLDVARLLVEQFG